jgi:DedD protein
MDRRVKERLVGASILVVLIVLVVPELLSGPPSAGRAPVPAPQPVRNVTVDLATSKPTAPESAMDPAASSAQPPDGATASGTAAGADAPSQAPPAISQTRPATSQPATSQPAPMPAHPLPAPAPSHSTVNHTAAPAVETLPPAPRSPLTAAKPAAGSWAVQLGSFASRANADKLAHQLKDRGFSVYVVSGGSGASVRYRVRIGPMADRGAAAQTVAKLKSLGHAASFVPPAR